MPRSGTCAAWRLMSRRTQTASRPTGCSTTGVCLLFEGETEHAFQDRHGMIGRLAVMAYVYDACHPAGRLLNLPIPPSHLPRWGKGNGQKSKMPSGQTIEHLTVGGRTSAVVPAVQKASWVMGCCIPWHGR